MLLLSDTCLGLPAIRNQLHKPIMLIASLQERTSCAFLKKYQIRISSIIRIIIRTPDELLSDSQPLERTYRVIWTVGMRVGDKLQMAENKSYLSMGIVTCLLLDYFLFIGNMHTDANLFISINEIRRCDGGGIRMRRLEIMVIKTYLFTCFTF